MRDNLARTIEPGPSDPVVQAARIPYGTPLLTLVEPLVQVGPTPRDPAYRATVGPHQASHRTAPSDLEARNESVLKHYPVVQALAGRMARRFPASVDLDDLIGMGTLGLIDAVERFDPDRGVPFRAWSEFRIRGAILDGMREVDSTPRSVRMRHAWLDDTRTRCIRRNGDVAPDARAMARELGVDVEEYARIRRDAVPFSEVSLDDPASDDGVATVGDRVADPARNAEETLIAWDEREAVARALDALPERERQVTTMHYEHGLKLAEIGRALGVTESRVCQIQGRAIRRLRDALQEKELQMQ
ncbi:MAG: sigma-70 family RNA polymerase sigma factor [Deltaproteobacteria bacterium]|nr:sigma-70 family RNA polymerase sigma factor [Deltaproteobacteria bacterium]